MFGKLEIELARLNSEFSPPTPSFYQTLPLPVSLALTLSFIQLLLASGEAALTKVRL